MELPNVEGLVIAALKADTALADLVGPRVVPSLPAGHKTWPAIQVLRYGGTAAVSYPLVLDEAALQLDALAATKQAAFDVANRARHVLSELPGKHRLGWVTGVEVGALSWSLMDTFDPAVHWYRVDARVWAKPHAGTS